MNARILAAAVLLIVAGAALSVAVYWMLGLPLLTAGLWLLGVEWTVRSYEAGDEIVLPAREVV